MSLVVAYHRSPTDYAIAADTVWTGHPAVSVTYETKLAELADGWFLGWVGGLVQWQAVRRWLRTRSPTAIDPEPFLLEIHAVARAPLVPRNVPGDLQDMEGDALLVGSAGLWRLTALSAIHTRERFAAIGCAAEYAQGWFDRSPSTTPADLRGCVGAAIVRFAGVGGGIDVRPL